MAGVLDGVKVVSVEHFVVIPAASAYLADWGAEVIKVEPLTGEHHRGIMRIGGVPTGVKVGDVWVHPEFQVNNRNKKDLALDLKKKTGREILYQLIQKSDVFMSNFELSTLIKLGLGYDTLNKLNPRLVYTFVNGYGSKGPDKDERAFDDTAAWARSGLAHLLTLPGAHPPKLGHGMGDRNASAHVVAGIVGALLQREKTGKGQQVECSLYHCALWSISGYIQSALSGLPMGSNDRTRVTNPLSNTYYTKDGRWLQLMMPQSELYWPDLCRAIGRPDLEDAPRFTSMETRRQNCEELIRILDEIFASKTVEKWERICKKHRLIYSRVQTLAEVVTDPQAWANDFFVDLHHTAGEFKVLTSPVKFSQNPASVRAPAPELGQHSEEILLNLGYTWEDIGQLKEEGVIL